MFKKIEVWVLCLVIFIGFFFTILFGSLVKTELVGKKYGWFSKSALFLANIPFNIRDLFATIKPILDEARHKDLSRGFNIYVEPDIKGPKYLLLSRWDTDTNNGIVELVDIHKFEILHRWDPDITKFLKAYSTNNPLLKDIAYTPLKLFSKFLTLLWQMVSYIFTEIELQFLALMLNLIL